MPSPDHERSGQKPTGPSWQRMVIWVVVGGIGLWLLGSGIVGIIAKGG